MKKIYFIFLLLMTGHTPAFACPDCVKDNPAPDPIINEKFEYYDVNGSCEKEVQHQMKHKGIEWIDGQKYDSLTSWNMMWDYNYAHTPHGCICDSFMVKVDITVRYPRWVYPADVSEASLDQWNVYMRNLMTHEQGHRDIAVREASELSRAASRLLPAPTCEDLDKAVIALSRQRINKLRDAQNEYDALTNHGLTQRAIFPPGRGLTPE